MMSLVPTPFQIKIMILPLPNLGETQAASAPSSTKQKAAKNGAGRRKGGKVGKGGKGGKRKTGALRVSGGSKKRSGGSKRNKTKGKRRGGGGNGGGGRGKRNKKKGGAGGAGGKNSVTNCPGGALAACVELCPGKLGARVYGACVASCDKRC